jgi:hypothetical protein
MLRTYEIIKKSMKPELLQTIENEAQLRSQKRHWNAGHEPSVAPSYSTRPQTPSRARNASARMPTNPGPPQPSVAHARDSTVAPEITKSPTSAIAEERDNESVCQMSNFLKLCSTLKLTSASIFLQQISHLGRLPSHKLGSRW